MKKLRVLALMHSYLIPPEDTTGVDLATVQWKTEYDVQSTLRDIGHEVHALGVQDDLGVIRKAITEWKPDIAFNLLEAFDEVTTFDSHVVSYLELLKVPYTGCNPRGLLLSRDKALSKKLLAYHRIPIPDFVVFPRGRAVRRPKRLHYPLIVKSLTLDASIGISQASVVETDEKLQERVGFIHDSIGTDALVERYIEGRELYVGVLGNLPLRVFPVWELHFTKAPDDLRRIATERVKWSVKYQKKHGITTGEAKDLPRELADRLQRVAKRVFRALELSGYARIDFRLDPDGRVAVLEANPNPQIAYGEDFAESAEAAGVSYEALLQRIINLGLKWRPRGRE
jgi:D-alanine-D-alanine ligase